MFSDGTNLLCCSVREDLKVQKTYVGAMGISDQQFAEAYEDPSSEEYKHLAGLVNSQVSTHTCELLLITFHHNMKSLHYVS